MRSNTRRWLKSCFRGWPLILWVITVALVIAFAIPYGILYFRYSNPIVLPNTDFVKLSPTYLLVVLRRPEPMTYTSELLEHRPSRVALYRKNGEGWELSRGPLPIRSESTTLYAPQSYDLPSVQSYLQQDGYYVYGHKSVPGGVYWCVLRRDPEARHPYALAISDERSLDNSIHLDEPETIFKFTEIETTGMLSGSIKLARIEEMASYQKMSCFIHGSVNQDWMHRDSKGCMNLYRLARNGQSSSDWDQFQEWFSSYEFSRDGPILLAVVRDGSAMRADSFPPTDIGPEEFAQIQALSRRAKARSGE